MRCEPSHGSQGLRPLSHDCWQVPGNCALKIPHFCILLIRCLLCTSYYKHIAYYKWINCKLESKSPSIGCKLFAEHSTANMLHMSSRMVGELLWIVIRWVRRSAVTEQHSTHVSSVVMRIFTKWLSHTRNFSIGILCTWVEFVFISNVPLTVWRLSFF